jgi:hypothetical protein
MKNLLAFPALSSARISKAALGLGLLVVLSACASTGEIKSTKSAAHPMADFSIPAVPGVN